MLVGHDASPLVDLQTLGGVGDQRVGAGAQGHDHRVHLDGVVGPGDLHRAASAGGVRLAQLHLPHHHALHPAVLIGENLHRVGEEIEDDSLLLGVVDLLRSRGQLRLASPVHNMYVRAQAQGRSRRVHGHVAAADHSHLLSRRDGGVIVLPEGLHQVASGEVLVGGEHAVGILTGDSHEFGQSGAGADEHGLEAFLVHELVDGHGFAHHHVGLDGHAQLLHILDLGAHHRVLGQTKLGDAVGQHAAGLVEGLKNGHLVP